MHADGGLDFQAWARLIDLHLENGTSGIVVGGTTGESATLADAELKELTQRAPSVYQRRASGELVSVNASYRIGSDGIVRRMEVPAREAGTNWAVIALANSSDEQIDRLIVVPHYQMVGSKILWPDLGLSRVVNVTPSAGDRPDRQDSATADIFRESGSKHISPI